MMLETNKTYRVWLVEELVERKIKNRSYSLRAFAKDLGISKTTLSAVLKGQRHLSKKAALKVAERLSFSPQKTDILMKSISRAAIKSFSNEKIKYLQLREDQFIMISTWYYIAILTMAQLKNHSADPGWIAKKLGISSIEAIDALDRLTRLGFIKTENNRLVRITQPVSSTHNIPSNSVRKYHKQNLELARRSIDRDSVEERILGAISIPMDLKKMKEADTLISEFKDKFAALMSSDSPEEVYTLAIQFFPVTSKEVKA